MGRLVAAVLALVLLFVPSGGSKLKIGGRSITIGTPIVKDAAVPIRREQGVVEADHGLSEEGPAKPAKPVKEDVERDPEVGKVVLDEAKETDKDSSPSDGVEPFSGHEEVLEEEAEQEVADVAPQGGHEGEELGQEKEVSQELGETQTPADELPSEIDAESLESVPAEVDIRDFPRVEATPPSHAQEHASDGPSEDHPEEDVSVETLVEDVPAAESATPVSEEEPAVLTLAGDLNEQDPDTATVTPQVMGDAESEAAPEQPDSNPEAKVEPSSDGEPASEELELGPVDAGTTANVLDEEPASSSVSQEDEEGTEESGADFEQGQEEERQFEETEHQVPAS